MDAKEKVNEEQKKPKAGFEFPFGGFQKMSEMMKNCCGNEAAFSDCRSMMERMMEFRNGHETEREQAKEKASNEEQKV